MTSPSSAPSDLPEVSTDWRYIDLHHSEFSSQLPGDVVQLSLQVKTVRGMHTINRDAWGGHSHQFKKWGSQLTPNSTTRNKVEKFKSQWNQFVRGTEHAKEGKDRKREQPPAQRSHVDHNRMLQNWRQKSNMPWMFKAILDPPAHVAPTPTWSPVAAPLSSMAQLSAGMLPLTGSTYSFGSEEPSAATGCAVPKQEPQVEVLVPVPSTSFGPPTSPISSCGSVPELIENTDKDESPMDLSCSTEKKDWREAERKRLEEAQALEEEYTTQRRQFEEIRREQTQKAKVLEKEKQELQDKLLEMDIKIEKLESIPLDQFNALGNIAPPPVKEEKMVRFQEPPTSPGDREEEGMDVLPYVPSPPQEPEVKIQEGRPVSSEEEDVKESRRNSWAKRREAAAKKKLCLRLVKNKVGPNSLEVTHYHIPKTPTSPPAQLFPEVYPSPGEENIDTHEHEA